VRKITACSWQDTSTDTKIPDDIMQAMKILGLKPSWDLPALGKAFRRLAVQYHPDRCCEEKKAECREKFKEINGARLLLEDCFNRRDSRKYTNEEILKRTEMYRQYIKEYEDYINQFYSEWLGIDPK